MNEYTPTPEEVRRGWGLTVDSCRRPALLAEFDRMIAEVERAAAEKAWEAGYDDGVQRGIGLESTGHLLTRRHELGPIPANPYRRNEGEAVD